VTILEIIRVKMNVLVTGGAGFIGSALIRHLIDNSEINILNIDKLSYAGNLDSLKFCANCANYRFEQFDIVNQKQMQSVFIDFKPNLVMHLAAESHVDRSIDCAREFIQTNIVGTSVLLDVALEYWRSLPEPQNNSKPGFRFHHISTDEVYGSLGETGLFVETSPYDPSSPYSASKASSDHLVRAWHRTYGLPVVITNCSNNYGPNQFPEKLIPHMIISALHGKVLPIYGDGENVRDWLHVDDHVKALWLVANKGKSGETYNIGGHNEISNLEVVHNLCNILDEQLMDSNYRPHKNLIEYVADRPGHDQRYAIDASKLESELAWVPEETFESGIRKTVSWYLENQGWWQKILDGTYRHGRLGIESNLTV